MDSPTPCPFEFTVSNEAFVNTKSLPAGEMQ
jgi:hypothetical protein